MMIPDDFPKLPIIISKHSFLSGFRLTGSILALAHLCFAYNLLLVIENDVFFFVLLAALQTQNVTNCFLQVLYE